MYHYRTPTEHPEVDVLYLIAAILIAILAF
jgi:hypothetical protein